MLDLVVRVDRVQDVGGKLAAAAAEPPRPEVSGQPNTATGFGFRCFGNIQFR